MSWSRVRRSTDLSGGKSEKFRFPSHRSQNSTASSPSSTKPSTASPPPRPTPKRTSRTPAPCLKATCNPFSRSGVRSARSGEVADVVSCFEVLPQPMILRGPVRRASNKTGGREARLRHIRGSSVLPVGLCQVPARKGSRWAASQIWRGSIQATCRAGGHPEYSGWFNSWIGIQDARTTVVDFGHISEAMS